MNIQVSKVVTLTFESIQAYLTEYEAPGATKQTQQVTLTAAIARCQELTAMMQKELQTLPK